MIPALIILFIKHYQKPGNQPRPFSRFMISCKGRIVALIRLLKIANTKKLIAKLD